MKKSIVTLGITFLMLTSTIFAAPGDVANVKINGENKKVIEASININGSNVSGESPAFVLVDRTFVPVRLISEHFGYTVDWDAATKSVKIYSESKSIKLQINSNSVVVDGTVKQLHNNAIPRLATFSNGVTSTMVPIRFISENLGYEVGWDGGTKSVKISGNAVQSASMENLLGPSGTNGNNQTEKPNVPVVDVSNLQQGQPAKKSEAVKINSQVSIQRSSNNQELLVFESGEKLSYRTDVSGNSVRINFDKGIDASFIDKITSLSFVKEYRVDATSVFSEIEIVYVDGYKPSVYSTNNGKNVVISTKNMINGIYLEDVSGKYAIKIDAYTNLKFNRLEFRDPSRVVLDFIDATIDIENGYKDFKLGLGIIKNVRVSQFIPDKNYYVNDRIVRVVLDLDDGYGLDSLDITGNKAVYVSPHKTIMDHIHLNKISEDRKEIIFDVDGNSVINSFYDSKTKTMKLILRDKIYDISSGEVRINDSLLRSVNYNDVAGEYAVELKFRKSITFDENSAGNSYKLSVVKNTNISRSDITIAIDAGHGGIDPGAVASDGYQEKVVAKNVADRVQQLLEQDGFNIFRIRGNDESIDYILRGPMANDAGSDIFVSIHANSVDNSPNANGIEVLYAPEATNPNKLDEQLPLAKALLDSLISYTGANNRGTVKRPNIAVLKSTTMPAALVELGFLSNTVELEKLKDYKYQELLSMAIYKGILSYLENDF